LRLEFEDYAIYRARMGESPVDLTYDRGLVAGADVLGFGVTGQVVNGNGRGAAQSVRLGELGPLRRYEPMTGGVGYPVRRNFRVTGEATQDLTQGETRWTLGFVSAF
jgi:hypothetical protein